MRWEDREVWEEREVGEEEVAVGGDCLCCNLSNRPREFIVFSPPKSSVTPLLRSPVSPPPRRSSYIHNLKARQLIHPIAHCLSIP
jgi:hypothetical protein